MLAHEAVYVVAKEWGLAAEGNRAGPGDTAEEPLQVFFLLSGELCRIDDGVVCHAEDPHKATRPARMRTDVRAVCESVRNGDRQANASQNESQQMIREESADYDQALRGAWDELVLKAMRDTSRGRHFVSSGPGRNRRWADLSVNCSSAQAPFAKKNEEMIARLKMRV